ncbi:hypothetical protein CERZMDRAFT_98817 [Cercospora zeae-maydis SCOH1-5]|uniref:Uncharacterized protein n=1 Tax=Cercospora zeae-maydis SCOH1-5 TaxID=717836 RepID=A0A6A6FCF2_9PEZI|nr:hypothetical protein CERZMDRAFT_98817 [Cercospora zeae-maydis SCOH1-5]
MKLLTSLPSAASVPLSQIAPSQRPSSSTDSAHGLLNRQSRNPRQQWHTLRRGEYTMCPARYPCCYARDRAPFVPLFGGERKHGFVFEVGCYARGLRLGGGGRAMKSMREVFERARSKSKTLGPTDFSSPSGVTTLLLVHHFTRLLAMQTLLGMIGDAFEAYGMP